ncbi:hypothetical protein pb186bvf_008336 [Paramecium bursaria]
MKLEQTSVSWLLNLVGKFPQKDLEKSNLKAIGEDYMKRILQYNQLQYGSAYTYQEGEFKEISFYLYPNILIQCNKTYSHLILSNCSIQKQQVCYKESKTYGLILTNNAGNTYLFFSQFIQFRNWYKLMKQFCKLSEFLAKYKLTDKMFPGVYQCFKKSNNLPFTVQIYKLDQFENIPEIEEAVNNEIQILRSIKHQNLLQLRRVYEDQNYLFILYEQFKGETLFNLVTSSPQLHEVQIASILFQILQILKFLDKHQFYHGTINPHNIIINSNNQMLQIFLLNLSFKQYKLNEKLDWILNRQIEGFIAPEFYQGVPPNIQSDLYSVGGVLYFMAYPNRYIQEKNIEQFQIDIQQIKVSKKQQLLPQQQLSQSLFDFLLKIIEPVPGRIGLQEAMKHGWFVNIKNKIKQLNLTKKRKLELPSLRTIIELRSQSELDLKIQSQMSVRKSPRQMTDEYDYVPDEQHVSLQMHKLDFCQLLRKPRK